MVKQQSRKQFEFKAAARIPKGVDAQACGERIEELRSSRGGELQEVDIIEDSRDESSPYHQVFEWDRPDEELAAEHRKELARHLLRSFVVTIITPKQETIVINNPYVTTPRPNKPNASSYTSVEDAMADPEKRNHVIRTALRELLALRRKYAELTELQQVFTVIDKFAKRVA